jgi:hypothetical protein
MSPLMKLSATLAMSNSRPEPCATLCTYAGGGLAAGVPPTVSLQEQPTTTIIGARIKGIKIQIFHGVVQLKTDHESLITAYVDVVASQIQLLECRVFVEIDGVGEVLLVHVHHSWRGLNISGWCDLRGGREGREHLRRRCFCFVSM